MGPTNQTSPSGQTRRKYPRCPVSIDCQVDGLATALSTRLSELGIGGCFVDTRTGFGPGGRITITAALPSSAVVFTGTVLYELSGYGFGVGFDALPESTHQQLTDFLGAAGVPGTGNATVYLS